MSALEKPYTVESIFPVKKKRFPRPKLPKSNSCSMNAIEKNADKTSKKMPTAIFGLFESFMLHYRFFDGLF